MTAVGLSITLLAMTASIAFLLPVLAVPFGGAVTAAVLAGSMIAAATGFAILVDALRALERCLSAGANSAATTVLQIASLVGIAVTIVTGVVISPNITSPAETCTGPNR